MTPSELTGPGRLDWAPARDRLDLVADPVAAALRDLAPADLPALVAPIDAELADTATFCERYDVGEAESANCVVVTGRRGDETTTAAVMVLATDRADVNKVVRKHLGLRKISFAAQEAAVSATGMEYGGITPVGLPADWPVLVDSRVVAAGPVVIGGGIRGSKLAVLGADLLHLPGAVELSLAVGSQQD